MSWNSPDKPPPAQHRHLSRIVVAFTNYGNAVCITYHHTSTKLGHWALPAWSQEGEKVVAWCDKPKVN